MAQITAAAPTASAVSHTLRATVTLVTRLRVPKHAHEAFARSAENPRDEHRVRGHEGNGDERCEQTEPAAQHREGRAQCALGPGVGSPQPFASQRARDAEVGPSREIVGVRSFATALPIKTAASTSGKAMDRASSTVCEITGMPPAGIARWRGTTAQVRAESAAAP